MNISFIIPVYNCQDYLKQCVDSILNSPLEDYEIILINDGSKDDSLSICNLYSSKYDNIRLVDQENKGASAARNAGLDIALGGYVWFVDADDSICINSVTELLTHLKNGIDLICFKYRRVTVDSITEYTEFYNQKDIRDGVDLIQHSHTLYLWNKIYKREIIGEKRFAVGTKNLEDLYFNLCVLPSVNNIVFFDNAFYNYICISATSTSRSRNLKNLIKLTQDTLYFQKLIINDILQVNDSRQKEMFRDILNSTLAGHLFSLMRFYNLNRLRKVIKLYKMWGVYPICKTRNRKMNLFISFVNSRASMLAMYYLISFKSKLAKCRES